MGGPRVCQAGVPLRTLFDTIRHPVHRAKRAPGAIVSGVAWVGPEAPRELPGAPLSGPMDRVRPGPLSAAQNGGLSSAKSTPPEPSLVNT